jgi:predicted dehydrogenase
VSQQRVGVGLIGASASSTAWAARAHIPAIRSLPDFELRAISTSSAASAKAAAGVHEVADAYADHRELIAHPGVDLVVVSVKVPMHREIIEDVLAAGKMVFSEWPLGNGWQETDRLAAAAAAGGVRTFVGLQARFVPEFCYLRDLVRQGYVGDVLSTSLIGSSVAWGSPTTSAHSYMYDVANGATLLTVPVMHTLEALRVIFGEVQSLSAQVMTRQPTVQVSDLASVIANSAPDQVAVTGTFADQTFFSMYYRAGVSRGQNLHWEINGTEGDVIIEAAHGNLANTELRIAGGRGRDTSTAVLPVPAEYTEATSLAAGSPAANVARLYRQLARDCREGTQVVPDFAYAAGHARLAAAIERASRTGIRERFDGPTGP